MEIYGKPYPEPSEMTFRVAHGLRIAAKVWGQPIVRGSGVNAKPESGDVRIIAGHGFLDNAGTWDLCMPHFLAYMTAAAPNLSVTIVAIDWMGHGLSDHRDRQSDYSTWRHLEDLRMIYEELGWKRAVLIAHSMGGGIMSQFAGTFPDMVSHLVLVDNFGPWGRSGKFAPNDLIHHLRKSRALVGKAKPTYPSVEAASKARMKGQNPVSETAVVPLVERGLMEVEVVSELAFERDEELEEDDDDEDGSKKSTLTPAPSKLYTWRTDQRLTVGGAQHFNEEACEAYLNRVRCPVLGLLAETGHWNVHVRPLLTKRMDILKQVTGDLVVHFLPSTHHLHLEIPVVTARMMVDFLKTRLNLLDRAPAKKKRIDEGGAQLAAKL